MTKEKIQILLIFIVLIITSCTSNREIKIQEKELIAKNGLVTMVLPTNLLAGNSPEDVVEACYYVPDEKLPEGVLAPKDQMEDCYINSKGFVEMVYTEKQLAYRKKLMYESALMEADFYDKSALKKVEFENEELTSAKIYVNKSEYEGGKKDSMNHKSRVLVKVAITTYMGLFQIYNGTAPSEWKVHLKIYDVETKELLYKYIYPTDEFPKIPV